MTVLNQPPALPTYYHNPQLSLISFIFKPFEAAWSAAHFA